MTIATNSRYANSQVVVANDLDGNDIQAIVPSVQAAYTFTATLYQVAANDTLPNLANTYYGDPTLWWVIADANPEVLLWDNLTIASFIRIPASAGGLI
jgi:nucleoid-associated protein YgaU